MPPGRDEEHGRGGSGTAHHIGAPADQLAEDPEEVDDAEDPEPEELEEPEVLEVLLDESLEELEGFAELGGGFAACAGTGRSRCANP